jgi:hypothetical protein
MRKNKKQLTDSPKTRLKYAYAEHAEINMLNKEVKCAIISHTLHNHAFHTIMRTPALERKW